MTRIDHLARSTFDLFAIVKRIVDAGAQFRNSAGERINAAGLGDPLSGDVGCGAVHRLRHGVLAAGIQ